MLIPTQDQEFVNPLLQISTNTTDLAKNLRILYVSPSTLSLQTFSGICNSPFLQDFISHVIFLPRAAGCLRITDEEVSQEDYTTFLQTAQKYTFEPHITSDVLREGLASLPKLTTISVQNVIAVPGLNASAVHFSESLKREYELKGVFPRDGGSCLQNFCIGFQTLEPLFEAMVPALDNVKTLSLGDEHSSQLHHSQLDFNLDPVSQGVRNLFNNLTKLSISSTAIDTKAPNGGMSWTYIAWYNIALEVTNLVDLEIFEDSRQHLEQFRDVHSVASTFLLYADMQELEKLHLLNDYESCMVVDAKVSLEFFQRHRRFLEEVVLRGMLIDDFSEKEDWEDAMTNCLSTIHGEMQRLRSFEMHVSRPEHEAHRIKTGQLAQKLNVFHRASGWDFGEYVMRQEKSACKGLAEGYGDGWGPGLLEWNSDSTMS